MKQATAVVVTWLLAGCASTSMDIPDALTPGIFLDREARDALPFGVELRPIIPKGIQLTKESEGFRSFLYNDAARYCTIAYGHLIKRSRCDGTEPEVFKRGISEPAATELLLDDMAGAQRTVMKLVTTALNDNQFAALCDFVYNVGRTNFKTSRLLEVVNAGWIEQVPIQLRRWTFAGGKEFEGLKRRREREIRMFFEGLPTPRAAPPFGEDISPLDIRTGSIHQQD